MEQGLVGAMLVRADEGSEWLRDGEGEQEVRPRELLVEVALEPGRVFRLHGGQWRLPQEWFT